MSMRGQRRGLAAYLSKVMVFLVGCQSGEGSKRLETAGVGLFEAGEVT